MIITKDEKRILFTSRDMDTMESKISFARKRNLMTILRNRCYAIERMVIFTNRIDQVVETPMYHVDIDEAINFMKSYSRQDNRGFVKKSRKECCDFLVMLKTELLNQSQEAA